MYETAIPNSKRNKYLSHILVRDGNLCLYCGKVLTTDDMEFEHLDNNDENNAIENLILAHHGCNCKKRENSDYQILAKEKLEKNKKNPLFLGGGENLLEDPEGTQEQTLEMKVRTDTYQITKQYLLEHIQTDGETDYNDAIYSISYYCMEKTGHGSPKVIKSHIDTLCSSIGELMVVKGHETKKKIIVKRMPN